MKDNDILDDFSVVIQGKIFGLPDEPYEKQLTVKAIESIRRQLPNAEIIISTWEGSDVSHLKYDKVVFNKDPGAIPYSESNPNYLNNNNRQITSTLNGLKAATKKYAIKTRGDCQLTSTEFISFFSFNARCSKFKFFKNRVIISTKYSRNPRRIAQLVHPSDIFQVGLTEDLLNLWDIPLQPEPETTRAIAATKRIFNEALPGPGFRMRYGAEQYNWYAFSKKNNLIMNLKHYSAIPVASIFNSELSIINNFVIVEPEKMGLLLPERLGNHVCEDLYTHEEWKALYHKYCIKGATKWDEVLLVAQTYISNVQNIMIRGQKSFRYRSGAMFKRIFNNTTSSNTVHAPADGELTAETK